ncbi:SPOR domain-containing protein [Pulveribacter suum]|uniref:Sporulation protein n=1 Tax=Pulveribacter suum TaxID=2116657 RepID=A0A2P1NKC3_9BURK|nr:SPOR domain-containing protein [Pulveribacter suum]AVP57518.1 sporulation protein [Pulveribacter suum]
MAFFKFRWPGKAQAQADKAKPARRASSSPAARAPQAESLEDMRRRARHRLIGAAVLVLAGVVGFPLLFDSQPRPIPVNVAIDIPDRNKVAPLVVPHEAEPAAAPAMRESASAGLGDGEELLPAAAPVLAPPPAPKPEPKPDPKPEPKAEHKPEPRPEPKPEAKPEPKPEPRPDPRPAARSDDAARARALLEGRQPAPAAPAAEAAGRFIVQVGAFADADKAREVQGRLERSGLKAYTQAVDTRDGRRTRVRVGPFSSRAEADKAAERVKGAGLSGAVLAL